MVINNRSVWPVNETAEPGMAVGRVVLPLVVVVFPFVVVVFPLVVVVVPVGVVVAPPVGDAVSVVAVPVISPMMDVRRVRA